MGKKVLYVLIVLFLVFLLPKNVSAQNTGGGSGSCSGCQCGCNGAGQCNVNCQTLVIPSINCDGQSCTYVIQSQGCNNRYDCAKSGKILCIGGECGGAKPECIARNCPAGTVPDWTITTPSCASWAKEAVCGNSWKRVDYGPGCRELGLCSEGFKCKKTRVEIATCVPVCPGLTAPSNVTYTPGLVSWTTGAAGTGQTIQISKKLSDLQASCGAGTACVVNDTNVSANASSYPVSLEYNKFYYVVIINKGTAGCVKNVAISFQTEIFSSSWWQIKNGDLVTNGDLISPVPPSRYFSIEGAGLFPGVPVFGGALNLTTTNTQISTTKWNANTLSNNSRRFDYQYFRSLVPTSLIPTVYDGTTQGTIVDGYEWYENNGNLALGTTDFGTRKVILFVNGDLMISHPTVLRNAVVE